MQPKLLQSIVIVQIIIGSNTTLLGIIISNAYVDEFSLQMYYGPCMGSIVEGTLWETGYYKQPTTAELLAMHPIF